MDDVAGGGPEEAVTDPGWRGLRVVAQGVPVATVPVGALDATGALLAHDLSGSDGTWPAMQGAAWLVVPDARATVQVRRGAAITEVDVVPAPRDAWPTTLSAFVLAMMVAALGAAATTLPDTDVPVPPTAAHTPPVDAAAGDVGGAEPLPEPGGWLVWPPEARSLATLATDNVTLRPSTDTTPPWVLACRELAGLDPTAVQVRATWSVTGGPGVSSRLVVQAWPAGTTVEAGRVDTLLAAHAEAFADESVDRMVTLPTPLQRARLCAYARGPSAELRLEGVRVD